MISFRTILFSLFISLGVSSVARTQGEQQKAQPIYSIEYLCALCTRMANQIQLDSKKITVAYDNAVAYANVTASISQDITTYHIRMNSDVADSLTRSELVAVMGHELMHIAHGDFEPRDELYQPMSKKKFYVSMGVFGTCAAGIFAHCLRMKKIHPAINGTGSIVGGIAVGYLGVRWYESIRKLYAHYRFFADSRQREAYADQDAAQKFHCAPGLISFFEKTKQSCQKPISLLRRIRKLMKSYLNTHPTDDQRIIALKKIALQAV